MIYFIEPGDSLNILFQFVTGATPDAEISKDGEPFVATADSPVEISDGYFNLELMNSETAGARCILVRVFDGSNPEYWTVIQTRALKSEITGIVRTQLTNANIPQVVEAAVSTANRSLKQFIGTENLTTRARRPR